MAARSKKRLSIGNRNKSVKLEKLELKDVVCSICQSILIEPVSLPCYHCFCLRCFNGSVENNALCCPLCRLRIGSWLRTATKQKNVVNVELWDYIKSKFTREIDTKLRGEDIGLPQEKPLLRLSVPGEIRTEYEAELQRLEAERLALEQKQLLETQELIKKLQQEEMEVEKRYLERLKQDEALAQQMVKEHLKSSAVPMPKKQDRTHSTAKAKLRPTKIDGYLSKIQASTGKDSPLLTEDNTSSDASTPKEAVKLTNRPSPEMVPNYGKFIKTLIEKKNKTDTHIIWNKENGDNDKAKKKDTHQPSHKEIETVKVKDKEIVKTKNGIKSLLVSLPLPRSRISKIKNLRPENRKLRTGSVDSMHQELCYFKPIEQTTPMKVKARKGLPLRVPGVRASAEAAPARRATPGRAEYLEELCRLRSLSLASNLPSAFVIALNILRVQKARPEKCGANTRSRAKRSAPCNEPSKKTSSNTAKPAQVNDIAKLDNEVTLRRTRSMGSMKDENETTPKKVKIAQRKHASERKPYLRSDSKKLNAKKRLSSPTLMSERLSNNTVNLAVKNLSSPLKNCDVTKILQQQLRIEKMIEQEKNDLELARRMDAEWNIRRQPRRCAAKRQATLDSLRPAKKFKV